MAVLQRVFTRSVEFCCIVSGGERYFIFRVLSTELPELATLVHDNTNVLVGKLI